MSSIREVQAAEKKVQAVLRELKETDLTSRDDLHQQLAEATDEYVKAIADLKVPPSTPSVVSRPRHPAGDVVLAHFGALRQDRAR